MKVSTLHRLKRRTGPNYAWHCDSCDGYPTYGFPVCGCIDGRSGKILWMYITSRSNNQPNNITTYYLDSVEEFGRSDAL